MKALKRIVLYVMGALFFVYLIIGIPGVPSLDELSSKTTEDLLVVFAMGGIFLGIPYLVKKWRGE